MNTPAKKKQAPKNAPAAKGRKGKAAAGQQLESEQIERAVYDGMQDLRVKKPR